MTAKQLFKKSMPFCMAKLGLGAAAILLDALLLAILLGIGWLFGGGGIGVCIFIWCCAIPIVQFLLMHYVGYLIKAGHVAVIAEAYKSGQFPENQVSFGKSKVKERFATSNVYFAIDKLVSSAIKQIQRGIEKVAGKLDFIPGMGTIAGLANFFVEISLGYVDECCLGWTFYNPGQGAFKSAADGVVLYTQNWKVLLKNAAATMIKAILAMILVVILAFVPIGLLFKLLHWNALIAFILACLIAWVIKFAFFDSFIMCQMMAAYMQTAPNSVITFDLYGKLCKISRSFKKLFEKGKTEEQQKNPDDSFFTAEPTVTAQTVEKPVFCGECGMKNEPGTKFCGSCGAKLI